MNQTEFFKIVSPNKDFAVKINKSITADMYENHNFNNDWYVLTTNWNTAYCKIIQLSIRCKFSVKDT